MPDDKLTNMKIEQLVAKINETYEGDTGINLIDASNLPVHTRIARVLELMMEVLFPGYTGNRKVTKSNISFIIGDVLCQLAAELQNQIECACKYRCRLEGNEHCHCSDVAQQITMEVLTEIPKIRQILKSDVASAYSGDPAAQSYEEIVISYPCITAISVYRVAHELYLRNVPLIPRLMCEYAHSKTGIDIHPGATIGRSFFIDHGTGVVIGETTVIGENVKLYQGTTLGALSFPKDERGMVIKGGKRHPTIEDNVTIYAEATLLGDITIGHDSVVGGNVWLTDSVPPNTTVSIPNPELVYKQRKVKQDTD